MKKEPMKSFEIIKEMYEHFVKKSRKQEPKLMICEKEDFDNVETALKEYEAMNQTKIVVVDDKVNEEDFKELKNQRMFTTILQPCEIKPLFDEKTKKKLKALEIIKECFGLNGFDELVPNSKWFESKEKQDLLKEVLIQ